MFKHAVDNLYVIYTKQILVFFVKLKLYIIKIFKSVT